MVRTVLVRLAPALIAAPLLVAGSASPATACSCAEGALSTQLERADAVFVGQVLDRKVARERSGRSSSSDRATYVFRVDRVFKGEVRAEQEVVSVAFGASCGLELPASGPALVFGNAADSSLLGVEPEPGQLVADLCNGTRAGSTVPAGFGPGRAPAGLPGPETTPVPPGAAPADTGGPLSGSVALGLLPVLAVAAGLLARRRVLSPGGRRSS